MAAPATVPTWTNRTGIAAHLLEAVLALPVEIERVDTTQLELGGATSFTRVTTIVPPSRAYSLTRRPAAGAASRMMAPSVRRVGAAARSASVVSTCRPEAAQ